MNTPLARHLDRLRRLSVLLLLAVPAATTFGSDVPANPPATQADLPADERQPGDSEVVNTPHGRWRVHRQDQPPVQGLSEDDLHNLLSSTRTTGPRLAPIVYSNVDLRNMISSHALRRAQLVPREEPLFVVPGVPKDQRYEDPRYEAHKSRFDVDCVNRAEHYINAYRSLAKAPDFLRPLPDALRSVAKAYERKCFTRFNDIPDEIRKVVGTLLFNGAPFCSATLIGEHQLLTARHCFFSMETGYPEGTLEATRKNRIVFRAWAAHHGSQSYFTVDYPHADTHSAASFPSQKDLLTLPITDPAETWLLHHPLPPLIPAPVGAWLVGTNALLGDLNNSHDLENLVRATGPHDACALLETTSAGCIYHTCQAGPTTSGAGLIVKMNGRIGLVGVHGGTMANADSCEADAPTNLTMNLAARYPSTP